MILSCEQCGLPFKTFPCRIKLGDRGKFCGRECYYAHKPTHDIKHGKTRSTEYRIWTNLIQRCTNPKNKRYQDYGGRGISVCQRWREFKNFYEDMGSRPRRKTIERIDNSKGYSPDNCRWATQVEQSNNMRSNRPITYKGVTRNLCQWADELEIDRSCLRVRIDRGWTLERAFTQPPQRRKK